MNRETSSEAAEPRDDDAAQSPAPQFAELRLRPPEQHAGGLGAVSATMHHLRRETGLVRGGRGLLQMNQPDGFDCPGCAWPESTPRGSIEFCENGAKAFAEEGTRKRATPEVFAQHDLAALRAMSDFELGQLGRITEPMVLERSPDAGDDGAGLHYRAISWDQAFTRVGQALRQLDDPDQAVFYTSGRTSNEAAFLYQLVARLLGTNNLPDCANMCHESSGVGMGEVVGAGKGTVSLEDFEQADAILVIGQNPGTNHPRMLSSLREAARRGCRIVSINPLREPGLMRFSHPQKVGDLLGDGVALASEFLQVRIGGDLALLQGLAKAVIEAEDATPGTVLDREFIDAHTTGFDDYAAGLRALEWATLCADSGIDEAAIRRVADIYIAAKGVIACWAMGITQHKHGVANVQEIINLLLLRGNIGRPGAGACPVRGHSNVQGDRTVGITPRPKPAFLDHLADVFAFEPPREPGLDTVDAIAAMERDEVRVFCAMGGNLYSAAPDCERVGQALSSCALTAHITTKLNRSHLYPGESSLLLPCLGRSERDEQSGGAQFVTVEDSMSMVHRSQGRLPPASDKLLSEPAIACGLGKATFEADSPGGRVPWDELCADYDRIRALIERVLPAFADYNQRVRTPAGFRLPNPARERDFRAVGGKARFTCHPLPDLALPPGRLRMMTIRSHDQYNTTIYGHDDRYRGVRGERRVVFMNPEDIADRGLAERQIVDLTSEFEGVERVVRRFIVVPYELPRGCAATYFPEANPLVPLHSTADKSNTPTSKSVVIRVEPTRA
ncbi:FdhF/YdeP family oxidoreductase [Haliangium ochraceum]|uniref:Oxidoreductase alpha (Molybdopterin) subunit n=1 Tax=Haliangium ochraceum (strain DSM 14365 / JCM 11303 / SMP-2) TaxID=502025 RepID=D0LUF8_HALO1|nr:FdhF/YdeP family oxidoreductase [Haliangium ochraceum]ACY19281.1 oxidoreductase alpha (molybdopterin) subunit [Haliangium ochraceum DSM 14365]